MELTYDSFVALWCKQFGDEPPESVKVWIKNVLAWVQEERERHPERSLRSIYKEIITALEQRV